VSSYLITEEDLDWVRPVVRALGVVSDHRIKLLRLMPPECSSQELDRAENEVHGWSVGRPIAGDLEVQAAAAVSRVHRVLEAAEEHDVLTMAMHPERGLHHALFGSLAREVADRVDRTTLLVYPGAEQCPQIDSDEDTEIASSAQ
jgi:hypothetical protein